MKKILLVSIAGLALTASSALAADLPVYKAPPPPIVSWTGCYVDGGVGYGMWKQNHHTEGLVGGVPTVLTPDTSTGGDGWLGRVGVGCDYQVSRRWLIGAFADYDFMNLSGSFQDPFFGWIGNEKERGAWAVGARIGYLVTPRLLTFFDGGYTQARFDQINLLTDAVPQAVPPACGGGPCFMPATTYSGWFLGGGTEYALDWDWVPIRGLFWRNEYRYANYGTRNVAVLNSTGAPLALGVGICDVGGGCAAFWEPMHKEVQTVMTSLVWRFNWDAPVVARY